MAMERILFRKWAGQQTRPSEKLTMDACHSGKFFPKKKGVDARLLLQMKASTPVNASTASAVPVQTAAAPARPAGPAPRLASADLSLSADGRG